MSSLTDYGYFDEEFCKNPSQESAPGNKIVFTSGGRRLVRTGSFGSYEYFVESKNPEGCTVWTGTTREDFQMAMCVPPDKDKDVFSAQMLALTKDATSLVNLYHEKCTELEKLQTDYQTMRAEVNRLVESTTRLEHERDQANLMADGHVARTARAQLRINELELLLNAPAAESPRRKFNLGGS